MPAFYESFLEDNNLAQDENSLPGIDFTANPPKDWVEFTKSMLNSIKGSTSNISNVIYWVRFASRIPTAALLFSTFSNNHLNIRFLGHFAGLLHTIQPYAKDIDGTRIAAFLRFLKSHLNTSEQVDGILIISRLKQALPEKMVGNVKLDSLIAEIESTGTAIKDMLTEDFINDVQALIGTWGHFIGNVPTWGHLTGVYFLSLLFTANSLPKYFNALTDISKIMIEFKGAWSFALVALPMYSLAAAMLPLNLAIQCSWFLLKTAAVTATKLMYQSFKLLSGVYGLVFSKDREMLAANGFAIFEALVNITLRITINLILNTLNAVVYILSNKSPLAGASEVFNTGLDLMLDYFKPDTEQHGKKPAKQSIGNNGFFKAPPSSNDASVAPSNEPLEPVAVHA